MSDLDRFKNIDPVTASADERREINDARLCPKCLHKGKRIHTRREVNGVHRRKQCPNCKWRWTTIEVDLERIVNVLLLERAFADAWLSIRYRSASLVYDEKTGQFVQRQTPFPPRQFGEDTDSQQEEETSDE